MFSKFYRKDYLILMKATKILIIYSLIFILLNSTIVLAEQRNGIYEPLDYLNDNTPLSIAIPSSNAWKTEIAASEINSEWNDNDEFSIVNFDNADMSFDNNNVLTMTFNNVDYENGNLVVLLFHNKTKDEYSALQIDFSETGIPTFQSEIQRDRVMKNSLSRSGSIIVDDNIPETVNDAKQEYNKNVEPPMDIVLADSQGAEYNPVPYTDAGSRQSTTTSSTKFYVYNANGIKQDNLTANEPFYAIQYLSKNRKTNWYVAQSNDGTVVFKYEPYNTSKFYLFQFGNFYGTATTAAEVKDWTSYALYSHSVRADGVYGSNISGRSEPQPYSHSYSSAIRAPEVWALEGNTGAYVYKKSISYDGYKSMSSKVLLSQAKLKFDSDTPTNAYIYMSSNSNHSSGAIACDIGLIGAPANNGGWYLIASRNNNNSNTTSSAGMKTFYSSPIVQSTLVNGEYRPKHDIYLYYTYGDGTVYCQVQNVITGVAQEGYVDDYRFNTSAPNICLMTGTSLVPDIYDSTGTQTAGDIKCGAYLKNVIWSENKIYKQSLWKGTAYSFAGNNSSTTNYLLTYDRDNASCTATSDRDTINIFYDAAYEQ